MFHSPLAKNNPKHFKSTLLTMGGNSKNTGGQKEKKYKAKQFRSNVTDGARDGQEPMVCPGCMGQHRGHTCGIKGKKLVRASGYRSVATFFGGSGEQLLLRRTEWTPHLRPRPLLLRSLRLKSRLRPVKISCRQRLQATRSGHRRELDHSLKPVASLKITTFILECWR